MGPVEWHSLPRRQPAQPLPTPVVTGSGAAVIRLAMAPEDTWFSLPGTSWDGDVASRAESRAVSGMGLRTHCVGAWPRPRDAGWQPRRHHDGVTTSRGWDAVARDPASTEGSP